jgi:hypothetical protein
MATFTDSRYYCKDSYHKAVNAPGESHSEPGPFPFCEFDMIREMREKLGAEIEQLSHELNVVIPQASTRPPSSASSSSRRAWGSCTIVSLR